MAGIEPRLISKILNTRDLNTALEGGITRDFFHGDTKEIFKYIKEYHSNYGKVPAKSVIRSKFSKFEIRNTKAEPYKALIDEMRERQQYDLLRFAIQESAVLLPDDAGESYKRLVRGIKDVDEQRQLAENPIAPDIYSGGIGDFKPVSLGKQKEPAPEDVLMGGLIANGAPSTLFGDGGQGKSYIALAIATAVAGGLPILGHTMPQSRVLYIDWELSIEAQTRRAFKIARGMGLTHPPKKLYYANAPMPLPRLMARIRALVKKRQLGLIVIDSFGPACGNNPEAADGVMPIFNELRSLGVTVLILDHQAKMQEGQNYSRKTPFGSAYKFNLSRSVVQLERAGSQDGELKIMLRHLKNNHGPLKPPSGIKILFKGVGFRKDTVEVVQANIEADPDFSKHQSAEEKILRSLTEHGPGTKKTLSERTGIKPGTIENTLPRLRDKGLVRECKEKEGRLFVWESCSQEAKPKKSIRIKLRKNAEASK
jgi:DNA-binding transcriptional ArsR family regulator